MAQLNPHAALAIEYWTIALTDPAPWKQFQLRANENVKWTPLRGPTAFCENYKYRRIPKTTNINGYEFPEPLRVAPEEGTRYFGAATCTARLSFEYRWCGDKHDLQRLRRGRIHLTQEAAEAHARAEILATGGEV